MLNYEYKNIIYSYYWSNVRIAEENLEYYETKLESLKYSNKDEIKGISCGLIQNPKDIQPNH